MCSEWPRGRHALCVLNGHVTKRRLELITAVLWDNPKTQPSLIFCSVHAILIQKEVQN
jgi:hypothetical protein